MGHNDYLDFRAAQKRNSYRRRRRHPLPLLVLVILIIGIIVGTVLLLAKENASHNGEPVPPTPSASAQGPTPTPTPTPVLPTPTPPTDLNSEEKKEVAQGPFGLWEPTASPTPTIAIPEGEVIWMADYVDKRTPVEAKGVYVSPDVAKDNAYMEELLHYLGLSR